MLIDDFEAAEASRLRALGALGLLDTPAEREFDAIAALAADLLGCPIGLITLVAEDRQWVKAAFGTDLSQTSRDTAFCDHTVRAAGRFVVEDASSDDRFARNPLVTDDPGIRFYAGMPISAADPQTGARVPIGAVCAIDTRPRRLNARESAALDHLATLADALIRARSDAVAAKVAAGTAQAHAQALQRKDRIFRQAERMAGMGSWRYSLEDERIEWSDGIFRIYEVDADRPPTLQQALAAYPPHARAIVSAALAQTIETGAACDYETDFVTAAGRQRRVRGMGELELVDGRPVAVVGTFQDVTERHRIEESLRRSAAVDALTGIANRAAFDAEIERAMAAARAGDRALALLLIDVDEFKRVNDRYGHLAGDDVLRAFGRRLRRVAPAGFAARLGGDEFALILDTCDPHALDALAASLLAELRMPVHSGAGVIAVSGTIGVAQLDADVTSLRELIHRADTALYNAKRACRGSAQRFGALRDADRRAA